MVRFLAPVLLLSFVYAASASLCNVANKFKLIDELHADGREARGLAIEGNKLYVVGFDAVVKEFNADSLSYVGEFEKKHKEAILDIVGNGKYLYTGGWDNGVVVWDRQGKSEIDTLKDLHKDAIVQMQVVGPYFCSSGFEPKMFCYKSKTLEVANAMQGHLRGTSAMGKIDKGDLLITAGNKDAIHAWNVNKGDVVYRVPVSKGSTVRGLGGKGNIVYAGSRDGDVMVIDFNGEEPVVTNTLTDNGDIIETHVEGNRLFVSAAEKGDRITVYDTETEAVVASIPQTKKTFARRFAVYGDRLFTACRDGYVRVYECSVEGGGSHSSSGHEEL